MRLSLKPEDVQRLKTALIGLILVCLSIAGSVAVDFVSGIGEQGISPLPTPEFNAEALSRKDAKEEVTSGMIERVEIEAICTGADGSAGATAFSAPVAGEVLAVNVSYVGDDPATTDVTLADESDPAGELIVNRASVAADVKLYPRRALNDNVGGALTVYGEYVVHGRLKLVAAQANAGDKIKAVVWLRR